MARIALGKEIPAEEPTLQAGRDELILLLFYGAVITALLLKRVRLRKIASVFGILFLGIHMGQPISISHVGALMLGYLPSIFDQLFWWMLVVGTVSLTLVLGKNFYCYWMCPFGGVQYLASEVLGVRWKTGRRVSGFLKVNALLILCLALAVIFLTRNPAMGSFEPFSALFSLRGLGVQWYLLTLSVVGALFVPRFWCRFFCPVGTVLNLAARAGKRCREMVQVALGGKRGAE